MRLNYAESAKADIRQIVRFGIEHHMPDPVAFARALRTRFEHFARIKHPGRCGRLAGTREWVVIGTPYIAVFRWRDGEIDVLRVLHGAQRWP